MPDRDEFQRLAKEVREIAAGIFDNDERAIVLRFMDLAEKHRSAIRQSCGRRPARSTS